MLENAYLNSMNLAVENELETIAFPNISTGIYGFPKEKAAQIAIHAVHEFLQESDQIKQVYFVCFDQENHDLYQKYISVNSTI